jgi:hypothetical protein
MSASAYPNSAVSILHSPNEARPFPAAPCGFPLTIIAQAARGRQCGRAQALKEFSDAGCAAAYRLSDI